MPSKTETKATNAQKLMTVLTGAPKDDIYHANCVEETVVDGQKSVKLAKKKRVIAVAPAAFAAVHKADDPEAAQLVFIASLRLYGHPDAVDVLLDSSNPLTGALMTENLRNLIRESCITEDNVNTDKPIVTKLALVDGKRGHIDATKSSVERTPVRAYLESLKKPRELFKYPQVLDHIASLAANVSRKMFLDVTEAGAAIKTRKVCTNPVECVEALHASGRYAEISNMVTNLRSVGGKSTRVWTGITGKKKTEGGRHVSSLEVYDGVFVSSCVTKEGVNDEKKERVINAIALYQAWMDHNPEKTFTGVPTAKQVEKARKLFEAKLAEHEANKKANEKTRVGTGKKGKTGKKAASATVPRAKSSPQKVTKPAAEEATDDEDDAVVSPKKSPSPVTGKSRAAITTPLADDDTSDDEDESETGDSPKPVTPQGERLAALNRSRGGKTGGRK